MNGRIFGSGLAMCAVAVVVGFGSFTGPASSAVDIDAVIDRADLGRYECPAYTTYCRTDSQCDGYCGGVGAGACERGCCACSS